MEPIVYVVDDDDDIREQFRVSLSNHGLKVMTFARAEPFLEVFDPQRRGCLVLDERMPGLRGTVVLEKVRNWLALFPVLLVTGYADIPLAVSAMRTGAFDVIEKPCNSLELVNRIQMALQHSRNIWEKNREDAENWTALQTLTPRETEILNLILEGHSSRTVGAKLEISPRTVDNHRVHIMTKLRAKSLGDLGRSVTRANTLFGPESVLKMAPTNPTPISV